MLRELREAMEAALAAITGVEANAYMVSAPAKTSASVVPADEGVQYDLTFGRGADTWFFTVEALTPMNDVKSAQIELDELVEPYGARSVKQALETKTGSPARFLGGLASACRVISASQYGVFKAQDNTNRLGVRFLVEVKAKGTP